MPKSIIYTLYITLSNKTDDDRQAYRGVGSVDRLDSDCRVEYRWFKV